MPAIKCKLQYHSLSSHLQQLYTGFFILYKRGLIELEQEYIPINPIDNSKPQHLRNAHHAYLTVIINDTLKLHYDTHDAIEINKDYLENCDFYFKRSFSQKYRSTLIKHQHKIFPLGLNYYLLPNEFDYFSLQRSFHIKKSLKDWLLSFIGILDTKNLIRTSPRIKQLESLPNYHLPTKSLFLVGAYNPHDTPDRQKEKVEERIYINETRAKCIRLLRQELKNDFLGGFIRNDFTVANYPELLVSKSITRKSNYLKILNAYPICIATTGLHNSIGGKMAEYVALSKAIVSEKLNYEVTGNFQKEQNYLEFITPQECVEQTLRLMTDKHLKHKLMINNAHYYQTQLKPEVLILNTLFRALSAAMG